MDRPARGLRLGVALSISLMSGSVAAVPDEVTPRQPGARAACPVCGMFVSPHPEWLAQVVYDNGKVVFFDGCKDLFAFLLEPERFAGAMPADRIAAIFVTSYYDQSTVSAQSVLYVAGSDVYGPMGAELIPLRDREEAEEFMRDHNGAAILRFEDVDAEALAGLG